MAGISGLGSIKMPSISKNVASAIKPSAGLMKSITSKLTSKMPAIPKIKMPGMGSSSKGLGSMGQKFSGISAGIEGKAFNPKLPAIKTRFGR